MFEYTVPEVREQIRSLPPVFFFYLQAIGVLNLSSVLLLRRKEARWVLAAMLFIAATNIPLMMSLGVVKAASIPHLFVWVPLIAYLATRLRSGQVDVRTPFGVWCFAVMMIDLVSVVFDVRDTVQYLLGDRGLVPGNVTSKLPVPSLVAIVASLAVVGGYALGFPRAEPETGEPARPGQ